MVHVQLIKEADTQMAVGEPTQLVVDGKTLTHLLGKPEAEALLAELGSKCTAVVVCRASPSQKANIVTMMRQYELDLVQKRCRTGLGRWFAKQRRNLGVRPACRCLFPGFALSCASEGLSCTPSWRSRTLQSGRCETRRDCHAGSSSRAVC